MSVLAATPLCPVAAQPLTPPELQAWLRLVLQPGLTPATARRLLQLAGRAQDVTGLATPLLESAIGSELARNLTRPPDAELAARMGTTAAWAAHEQHHLLVYADPRYPAALRELPDPPLLLYVRGDWRQLQQPGVALVGARRASAGGCELAHAFARRLAQAGWSVVSGLARGIDGAAHEGALSVPGGGGTVAVMATGIDRVYPRQHLALAQRITASGAVVSELPLGTPSAAFQFPRRNRLVAALSRGLVVVEAAARSGSLLTARLAADLGREVFAVPGSVHSPLTRGCHALIREGAYLTETADDILEALSGTPRLPLAGASLLLPGHDDEAGQARPAGPEEGAVLDALGYDPVDLDSVLLRTGLTSSVVQTGLLQLELGGRVRRLPDGRWEQISGAGP